MQFTPEETKEFLNHLDQSCRFMGASLTNGGLNQAGLIINVLTSAIQLANKVNQKTEVSTPAVAPAKE